MSELDSLRGKRIVLVFGSLDLGGAERQGLHVAEALKSRYGAEVEVWGLRAEPGRLSQLCDQKGIAWRGVACGWGRFAATRVLKLARFAARLRRAKPEVILSYTRLPNLICGLTWKWSGARCLVWNQRDEGLLLTQDFWNRLAVSQATCFISNSVAGRAFLERSYGVAPGKVAVIANGVAGSAPLASRSAWRERLGISGDCFVACMVANIHPYKDHRTLLTAWGELLGTLPQGAAAPVLLLAGRIESGREELEQIAAQAGCAGHVRFLGKVDDVAGLLHAVDLCVHSSVSEGLPNAVLEAMAAGAPVVGTDIPGIRAAVGPEGWPFLAPVGDAAALAALLRSFYRDPELRARLGRVLQERIERDFSLAGMCRATAEVIEKALLDPVGTVCDSASETV